MNMKRFYTFLTTLFVTLTMQAQGWPENYGGVMLQAFYWDGYADTQWTMLEKQADNLATTFDLVWIPQSGDCGKESMGYDDLYWFPGHYNSTFGSESELRSLINTFKSKGIGTIADVVVNHRQNVSNWVDFPAETYNGVTYQLKSTDIVANDDDGACKTWATQNGYSLSANNDTGTDWLGMRDLDHKSTNVQNNVKAYVKMLIDDMGYVGFRYDMVAGYSPTYTKMYNDHAQPQFSVGENFSGTLAIRNWIDGTSKSSAAFDFDFKYVVRNATDSQDWTKLNQQNDGNWPLVSNKYENGAYRRYAVTFVENHDTEVRPDGTSNGPLRKDTLAANAYLLAMPGTPCVFRKHWQAYRQEIANMVAVRKAVGITNMSSTVVMASYTDYFAVQVSGNGDKKLLCVVGKKAADYTPNDATWKKVLSGYHYVYYIRGIEPSSITMPTLTPDEQPKDGVYSGVPSFCTLNTGEIAAFFEAPVSWGSQIYTWAWMNGGNGEDYVGTTWPGIRAELLGTAPNGNKVFKWVSTRRTAPDNIIFSGGSNKTKDLPFTNGGYYTKDGCQDIVTTGIESVVTTAGHELVRIYTIDGHLLRVLPAGTSVNEALNQLKHGLYVINGRKVVK